MASVAECEQALHDLAARLAAADRTTRSKAELDRTVSCTLRDLGVIFGGRLHAGDLLDIRQVDTADAQVRMSMSSDDLIKLVHGGLKLGTAWATGRVRVEASMRDILRLRSIF
jgi:hypothetical protein